MNEEAKRNLADLLSAEAGGETQKQGDELLRVAVPDVEERIAICADALTRNGRVTFSFGAQQVHGWTIPKGKP